MRLPSVHEIKAIASIVKRPQEPGPESGCVHTCRAHDIDLCKTTQYKLGLLSVRSYVSTNEGGRLVVRDNQQQSPSHGAGGLEHQNKMHSFSLEAITATRLYECEHIAGDQRRRDAPWDVGHT